jgi:hypothetical protein
MMSNRTIRAHLDAARGRRTSSSSGSPLAPPKASPSAEGAVRARQREILDLLGHARPQSYAAMRFLI